jgi:hypothetical protein
VGDAVVIVAGTVTIDAPAPAPMPYLHFILGFLREVGKVSKVFKISKFWVYLIKVLGMRWKF